MKFSLGKWRKHNILSQSPGMVSLLPKTRRLNRDNLWSSVDQFGKVIIKPAGSSGGYGVMQVTSLGNEKYEVHYNRTKRILSGRKAAYSFIQRKTKSAPYIVQQKIHLAKVNGKPFDVRVMVQRKKGTPWTITGKLAKIAGPGFIITNTARSRGRAVPLSTAIRSSNIQAASEKQIISQLNRVSLQAVKRLQKFYRIHTVGLDLGIDAKGKVWFIEANFKPAKSLFQRLKDKSMYRKIMHFYRHR